MICINCNGDFFYQVDKENRCSKCGSFISIEEKIKPLVFSLNRKNFLTYKSCQGHSWDIGWPWPFITFFIEDDFEKLEPVLGKYNEGVEKDKEWVIEPHPRLIIKKWLIPLRKYKRLSFLQESSKDLAGFFEKNL